jgi:hypothetical protein
LAIGCVSAYIILIQVGGDLKRAIMAHLVDKEVVERANSVAVLGIWAALAACVVGALAYDIAHWLEGW